MAGAAHGTPGELLVFLSYRRQDTSGYAVGLYDALLRRFRPDQLFMDVDAIPPGVDFADYIQSAVGRCDALLALIGPAWLAPDPDTGQPRLFDANDYVRLEIEAALNRQVRVIPILLQGARLPKAEVLPETLRPLLRRNALEMSDARWRFDAERLIDVLEEIEAEKRGIRRPSRRASRPASITGLVRSQPALILGLGALVAVFLLVALGLSGVIGGQRASPSPDTAASLGPTISAIPSDAQASPTPTSPPPPTASTAPSTAPPTLAPIIAPGPLTPEEEELALRIPAGILYQGIDRICTRSEQAGAAAAVVCTFDPGGQINRIHYWLYPTVDTVKAAYRQWRPTAPVAGQGCGVGVPGETTYTVGTENAGMLGCFASTNANEGIVFVWSNERVRVLSFIVANPGTTLVDVFTFWRDRAGPFG
jgi:hypothetical protein